MKTNYLTLFILLLLFDIKTGYCTKHTVSAGNFDYAFSPVDVSAEVGDTIEFALGIYHSALEVSQATWTANGNSPLNGGFHVPFGGGETVVTQAKTYYYVCENHYLMGMKGIINVTNPAGIHAVAATQPDLEVFPNPVLTNAVIITRLPVGKEAQLKVYDMTGKCLLSKNAISQVEYLNTLTFPQGACFIAIRYDGILIEKKIILSR